jgi:hypothetical protein
VKRRTELFYENDLVRLVGSLENAKHAYSVDVSLAGGSLSNFPLHNDN